MILQVIVYVLVDGVWDIINLNWNSFKSKLIHNDNLSNFDSSKIDSSNNNILLSSVLKICLLLFQDHDVISSTFIKESVSTIILILRFHIQIDFMKLNVDDLIMMNIDFLSETLSTRISHQENSPTINTNEGVYSSAVQP